MATKRLVSVFAAAVVASTSGLALSPSVAVAPTGSVAGTPAVATAPSVDTTPTNRIVNGHGANRALTPWFVSLMVSTNNGTNLCGGTTISASWIVTAAHCVDDVPPSRISKSEAIPNPSALFSGSGAVKWDRVVVYPNPGNGTKNDIALVKTQRPMSVTPLAYSGADKRHDLGTAMQVFGFGAGHSGGSPTDALQIGSVSDLAGAGTTCGRYGLAYDRDTMMRVGRALTAQLMPAKAAH